MGAYYLAVRKERHDDSLQGSSQANGTDSSQPAPDSASATDASAHVIVNTFINNSPGSVVNGSQW
jgi:hypothetical protein